MKKLTLALFTIIASLFIISCGKAKTDANGCYYDFDDAVSFANKKNQDVMVIITVEGDDEDSTDFMEKVVRDANFKKEVASKYAVVCMDFSQKTFAEAKADEAADEAAKKVAEQKNAILEKNTKYATMLDAKEVPVIYIFSKEKYLIKGFFYDDENRSIQGFEDTLAEQTSIIDDMHKMIYQTKIGNAEEKVKAIDALWEATNPSFRIFLYDLINSVKKLDPNNTSGLLGKYMYEAASTKSDMALLEGNIEEAVQAFLDAAEESDISADDRQQAMYTAAYICSMTGFKDDAVVIEYLEKAIQIAPESDDAPRIRRVIAAISSKE